MSPDPRKKADCGSYAARTQPRTAVGEHGAKLDIREAGIKIARTLSPEHRAKLATVGFKANQKASSPTLEA
jgi:hypothetical protein